jgi:hypothetical protein
MLTAKVFLDAALATTTDNRWYAERLASIVPPETEVECRDFGPRKCEVNLSTETDICTALGIAAWDAGEHCHARVTHDLHSFHITDFGGLVDRIRLGD